MAFSKALDRKTNVTQSRSRLNLDDAVPHGLVGELAQTLGRNRALAHDEHAAGVAMPTIFDDRDVDVDDVALFQRFVVTHLMVDRGADGFGIGVGA